MARAVIEETERRGDLEPGMTVVEATGGSTGSSLAFVCAIKGYDLKVVSSGAFAEEKLETMAVYGTTVDVFPSPGGKITPELIPAMRSKAKEIAMMHDCYYADQYSNPYVPIGYEGLGRELLEQIPEGIDAFCGSVGGAEMIMEDFEITQCQLSCDCARACFCTDDNEGLWRSAFCGRD